MSHSADTAAVERLIGIYGLKELAPIEGARGSYVKVRIN